MKKTLFIVIFVLVGFSAALLFVSRPVSAQEGPPPEFLVTWQANTYVPPSYAGRALPRNGTPIDFAFELIEGGKLVGLSDYEVRWYLGDELVQSGQGLQGVTFTVPMISSRTEIVRTVVVDYRGMNRENIVRIPIVRPEAIIDLPYPQRTIPRGGAFVRALPYYFSVPNKETLLFEWRVNNETPLDLPENPSELVLNIPTGGEGGVQLNLRIINGNNNLEFSGDSKQLLVQ